MGTHYHTKEWMGEKAREISMLQWDSNKLLELWFKKDEHGWYAIVEGHTRAQNAMVAGADTLIEKLANGSDAVCIRFRTEKPGEGSKLGKPIATLKRIEHDAFGATYLVFGLGAISRPAWLCNVTETVLGEHPKRIYIYGVSSRQ